MRRIGIFGGSFNPIHNGHILLAQQLRRLAGLEEVWLMVSPQNPLKRQEDLLSDEVRMELVREALKDEPGLVACDYEMHLPRPSYTWLTLQALERDYPDCRFILLIGGDNWELFHRWYHAEDILKNYDVCVYPRRSTSPGEAEVKPYAAGNRQGGVDGSGDSHNPIVVEAELLDISSTDIRQRVREGRSIKGLVPSQLIERIETLYAATSSGR